MQDLGMPLDLHLPTASFPQSPQVHSNPTETPPPNSKLQDSSSPFQAPWDDEFCSVGLQERPVFINRDLTIRVLQAPTEFRGVQHDETGTVLWGASICLARFLSPSLVQGRSVLELGCGCGLPSLVAAYHGAFRVVASDMEDGTLQQLDKVAQLNQCSDALELIKLNWKDEHKNVEKVDIILASDVIYHEQMVAPLVKTIDAHLSAGGKAYLALRNTRQGVRTLWQRALPEAGFELIASVSCEDYLNENGTSDPLARQDDDATIHRFRGDHTIYVFKKL